MFFGEELEREVGEGLVMTIRKPDFLVGARSSGFCGFCMLVLGLMVILLIGLFVY